MASRTKCAVQWGSKAPCPEQYSTRKGRHYCVRTKGHETEHRCLCNARSTEYSVFHTFDVEAKEKKD